MSHFAGLNGADVFLESYAGAMRGAKNTAGLH